jgi:geranylgeranyl diphosphate synthase type II
MKAVQQCTAFTFPVMHQVAHIPAFGITGLNPVLATKCFHHFTSMSDLKSYLSERCQYVDSWLDRLIPSVETAPVTIHKAMRHSVFAGGKRLRPILCLAAAEACGGSMESAAAAACAVECLHTYSLIHDDLPSMDNDDFRRGVPTCHKVFGDGIAVLAGDSLQALAFEMVVKTPITAGYHAGDLVHELAVTAGSLHLVGGQVADLEGEGQKLPLEALRFIHENKTAALLTTSLKLGGMSANATPEQMVALHDFGMATGLAFQIIDDILDVTQTSEKLGKSAGKDLASEKSTYPALIGLEASRVEAQRLTQVAHAALAVFGDQGQRLRELADYLLARDY